MNKVTRNSLFLASMLIVILAVIFVYSFWRAYPTWQVTQACAGRLHTIYSAIQKFEQEHGRRPASLRELWLAGMIGAQWLHCPFVWDAPSDRGADYLFVPDVTALDPPSWWLVVDPPNAHPDGKRNVLYSSGTVELLDAKQYRDRYNIFREQFLKNKGKEPTLLRDAEEAKVPSCTKPSPESWKGN